MSDQPLNGAQLLADIKPRLREADARICLRPDLVDAFVAAEEALLRSQAGDAGNQRLGSGVSAETKRLAKQVRELEAELDKSEVRFLFRAITKARFNEITDSHPPREQNMFDLTVGYNREAVDNELVRACLIDPEFDDASWQQLLEVCNPSEWEHLTDVVRECNGVMKYAPKSAAASAILDKPSAASRRRARSE